MDFTMRLSASVTLDGDVYVAQCLEVDVASQGGTIEEALANLTEALQLYLEGPEVRHIGPTPIIAPIDLN